MGDWPDRLALPKYLDVESVVSEYQYYEFQAIDRPLSQEQMRELRDISSRAEISSTRFTNSYSYGSFRGDERELLERYFDAHVYLANWGTHVLMFGLPSAAIDIQALQAYQAEGGFAVQSRGGRAILTFESQDEDSGGWVEDDEGSGWMGSLISLRADILSGDLRAVYLGWLRGIQAEGLFIADDESEESAEDDDTEPPVPPGLGSLSGPLKSLVEFLELDEDLVAVAAEGSKTLSTKGPDVEDLKAWIRRLSADDKDQIILRLMRGEPQVQAPLLRRFHQDTASPTEATSSTRRSSTDLLKAAAARTVERQRREAEAAARERTRRAQEAAKARSDYLTSLIGKESALWRQAEGLIDKKQPNDYDRAVQILVDLRDLADREGKDAGFGTRLHQLRERHSSKPSLMKRLNTARLP